MANIIITITIETWIVWTGCFEICNAFNYFLTEDYRYLFSFSFIAFHKKRNALEMVLYCTCCLVVFSFINMLSFLFFFLRLSSIYFVIIYFILLFWTPIANYSFSLNSSRFLIISNWFFSPELYSIQTFSCFFYLFFSSSHFMPSEVVLKFNLLGMFPSPYIILSDLFDSPNELSLLHLQVKLAS